MESYTLKIEGMTRELPLCHASDTLDIAAFVLFSDVELTLRCSEALLKRVPDFDIILTSESKGIPIGYEMARQSGKSYVVARKSVKLYMSDPIAVNVKSITTDRMQTLYLSRENVDMLNGKRVLIVDDVISTGESLFALEKLTTESGGIIAAKAAILAEGGAADREDIIYLEKLPVFPRNSI